MKEERPTVLSRLEELLEEFLSESAEARERFLYARPLATEEIRAATEKMLEEMESGKATEPRGLVDIPRAAIQAMRAGERFYRLWGEQGPPEIEVFGNEPVIPERRRRILALLRMGLDCRSREEGAEVLDRLVEARDGIPGLDHDFTCWLYLLCPSIFPPLPTKLFPGAGEVMAGAQGFKDTVRRLWAFSGKHALLLETDDLAVPAAFFQWLALRGSEVWARPRAKGPYYGAELLVGETLLSPAFVERLVREIQSSKLLLFTGASGTGKTYTALRFARYLIRDGGA
jgi:hypothetical protein